MTFFDDLKKRGLIAQVNHEDELQEILRSEKDYKKLTLYCGFDPTAKSLHVGHLVSLLLLRRAQDAGFTPIVLFGGATGLIGDPTGRQDLRPMSTAEQIKEYVENFRHLCERYFRFDVPNKPIFVNNQDWIGKMTWIDFARNVGVHFTIARLLAAEVNRTRFEEGGLTFMELGYQLLQAYDFYHLYKNQNCLIQLGGDDQWSNILAGADLIRRIEGGKAFAMTTPLLIAKDGRKFGKTAGNAIWLDASITSPYEFFQFFRNTMDEDVEKMFRIFTFLPQEEINLLLEKHINEVKEVLAYKITVLVHGEEEAQKALDSSKKLFSKNSFSAEDLEGAPKSNLTKQELGTEGIDMISVVMHCKLAPSRTEARKLIENGGLSLNEKKVESVQQKLTLSDFANSTAILKKGKKTYHLLILTN